jgi:hypothetical protein
MAATDHPRHTDQELRGGRDEELRGGRDEGTRATERPRPRRTPETKTFVGTSEFWMTIAAVAAIGAIYWFSDEVSNFDLWSACLLGVLPVLAYVLSRGIAKSGTRRDDRVNDRF